MEVSNEMEPLAPPPEVGAKVTANVAFCPAGSVKGNDGPLRVNPVPVTAPWETIKSDLLELPSIRGCVEKAFSEHGHLGLVQDLTTRHRRRRTGGSPVSTSRVTQPLARLSFGRSQTGNSFFCSFKDQSRVLRIDTVVIHWHPQSVHGELGVH